MRLETHAFPEWIKSVPVHFCEKMYHFILSPPTGYLLLNLENLGSGTDKNRTFHFSPSNFVSDIFLRHHFFTKKHLQTSQFK